MRLQFGQFEIDVDIDRTREFYKNAGFFNCDCQGCRNYAKAVNSLPEEVLQFFDSLGVDMKKAAEVWAIVANPDGSVLYNNFYHLCGKLLGGESAWVQTPVEKPDMEMYHWDNTKTFSVSNGFNVSFHTDAVCVEDDFPEPILQMEISANIPWVLDEENSYVYKPKKQSPAAPNVPKPSVISRLKRWLTGFIA